MRASTGVGWLDDLRRRHAIASAIVTLCGLIALSIGLIAHQYRGALGVGIIGVVSGGAFLVGHLVGPRLHPRWPGIRTQYYAFVFVMLAGSIPETIYGFHQGSPVLVTLGLVLGLCGIGSLVNLLVLRHRSTD